MDKGEEANSSLQKRQEKESIIHVQNSDLGIASTETADRNNLTDGMDGALISQIRDLTREYKLQSSEQFKRYQYVGHKAAIYRSGSAAAGKSRVEQ